MKIETGRGRIPLITLLAIWSISALNALPGLAVSPILGELQKIFPRATELDIQMLSSLPSLMIISGILSLTNLLYVFMEFLLFFKCILNFFAKQFLRSV